MLFSDIHPITKAEAAQKDARDLKTRLPDDVVAVRLADQVLAAVESVTASAGPKTEKPYTETLMRLDRERDQAYSGLCMIIRGHAMLPGDTERRERISRLYHRLVPDSNGFLDGPLYAESLILQERMAYLKSPEAAPVITELGIGPVVSLLEKAMEAFEKVWKERADKQDTRPSPLYKAQVPLDRALRSLHAYLVSTYGPEFINTAFAELLKASAQTRATQNRSNTKDTPQA